ncbi:2-hydroxymuconic semialdehyde dehydrogenase [Leptolyngbya valderiana BDU 20041]|nr:2-hydroxymuconic semialdehyde dehydrogenase [Leptolyngbya valderiana BDU 20041]
MSTSTASTATHLANWIGGQPRPASGGATIDNVDPATGQTIGTIPASTSADVDAAVKAATGAFDAWASLDGEARCDALMKLADAVEADLDAFARAESIDSGKPISVAQSIDIPRAVRNLRFFATAAAQFASESHDVPGQMLGYTLRRPKGVIGAISPWNLPLYLLTWKIAPALAAGCTVVAKPSELTPTTASMLGERAARVLPPGVLNIVHGYGEPAGASIVQHPGIAAVTFTGSTKVGRWIGKACGESLKPCSLELGGKNAFVVFDDADVEEASATAIRAAFSNQGQICLCGSRVLVQAGVYDRVVAALVEGAKNLKPGDPLDRDTRFGALVSHDHRDKVAGYVERAVGDGAHVLAGGKTPDSLPDRVKHGAFYLPTVLDNVNQDCQIIQEEVFGPVCTVQKFETEEEAIELANGTPYGLAASVWTNDLARAHRASTALEAGIVWVNCWMLRDLRTPFGGVKQSGVGREGGWEAMRFFTEPKSVTINTGG